MTIKVLTLCLVLLLVLAGFSLITGERIGQARKTVIGGDVSAGAEAINQYGCGACHTIRGIPGANTMVGPPLNDYAQRHYIAGNLPNEPDNLIIWLLNPQLIEPGTAMPYLGLTEDDARNIAAYLYSQ